jgi:hypothetical protein
VPWSRSEASLTAPKILLSDDQSAIPFLGSSDLGWSVLAGVGFALLALNLVDLRGLILIPRRVGAPQWELGPVASAYSALPWVTIGLALPLAAGIASGNRRLVLVMSSVLIPLGTLLLLTPLLYLSGLVMAWYKGIDPVQQFGLTAVVTRGAWVATVYPLLFLWMGVKGVHWAHSRD